MEEEKEYTIINKLKNRSYEGDIPDGYLQQLQHRMTEKQEVKKTRIIQMPALLRIAASFLLVVTAALWFMQRDNYQMASVDFTSLSDEHITSYIASNADDFSLEMLSDLNVSPRVDEQEDLDEYLDDFDIYEIQEYLQ